MTNVIYEKYPTHQNTAGTKNDRSKQKIALSAINECD